MCDNTLTKGREYYITFWKGHPSLTCIYKTVKDYL